MTKQPADLLGRSHPGTYFLTARNRPEGIALSGPKISW